MLHAFLGVTTVFQGKPQQPLVEIQKEPEELRRLHALAIAYHAGAVLHRLGNAGREDVKHSIGGRPLPIDTLLPLAAQIADALERVGFAGACNQRYLQLWSGAA